MPHIPSSRSSRVSRVTAAFLVSSLLPISTVRAQTVTAPPPAAPAAATTSASPSGIRLQNQAAYGYDATNFPVCDPQAGNNQNCGFSQPKRIENVTNLLGGTVTPSPLVDPLGRIVGCAGELLTDYTGFSIALYEADPADPAGINLRRLVPLTPTEVPDRPGNGIPAGLLPNSENSNPFFLTNGDRGVYNFLLDVRQGQLDQGRAYILVINPPRNSIYAQRRIRLVMGARNGNQVVYTAAALDGRPISSSGAISFTDTITIQDAEKISLVIAAFSLDAGVCQAQEIQIIKTGDRAAAEPGDTVIYRLVVRNLSSSALNNLAINDTLPLGFRLLPKSVRAEFRGTAVPITTTQNGSTISFNIGTSLPQGATDPSAVLNIAYAAVVTPDAVRGTGRNSAIATGIRADNGFSVKDGPATHQLRIRSGILSDCGTIIGRVFVDKNFDGEQQPGEPGVPNAVVFLDDGNRITTDPNGLFSVANVFPGYRSGVLDLSSIPGYTLAPNLQFSERNSQSRLVRLEPSGMVRMNFAVTPAFQEGGQP